MAEDVSDKTMQITQTGFQAPTATQLTQWRTEFAKFHCVVLPQLLAPTLQQSLWQQIKAAAFEPVTYHYTDGVNTFSQHLRLNQINLAAHQFHLLLNHPKLFKAVQQITACAAIGGFSGHIFRINPGDNHYLNWHEDTHTHNYLVGLSVNLGQEPYTGGVFQIRERCTKRVTSEIAHTRPGDAHLFNIAPWLQHRLTPLTGTVARIAAAGWFCVESDFMSALKRLTTNARNHQQ